MNIRSKIKRIFPYVVVAIIMLICIAILGSSFYFMTKDNLFAYIGLFIVSPFPYLLIKLIFEPECEEIEDMLNTVAEYIVGKISLILGNIEVQILIACMFGGFYFILFSSVNTIVAYVGCSMLFAVFVLTLCYHETSHRLYRNKTKIRYISLLLLGFLFSLLIICSVYVIYSCIRNDFFSINLLLIILSFVGLPVFLLLSSIAFGNLIGNGFLVYSGYRNFVLYLRPFSFDRNGGRDVKEIIFKNVDDYNKKRHLSHLNIMEIGNPQNELGTLYDHFLYNSRQEQIDSFILPQNKWKSELTFYIQRAAYIIAVLDKTSGVFWEIFEHSNHHGKFIYYIHNIGTLNDVINDEKALAHRDNKIMLCFEALKNKAWRYKECALFIENDICYYSSLKDILCYKFSGSSAESLYSFEISQDLFCKEDEPRRIENRINVRDLLWIIERIYSFSYKAISFIVYIIVRYGVSLSLSLIVVVLSAIILDFIKHVMSLSVGNSLFDLLTSGVRRLSEWDSLMFFICPLFFITLSDVSFPSLLKDEEGSAAVECILAISKNEKKKTVIYKLELFIFLFRFLITWLPLVLLLLFLTGLYIYYLSCNKILFSDVWVHLIVAMLSILFSYRQVVKQINILLQYRKKKANEVLKSYN